MKKKISIKVFVAVAWTIAVLFSHPARAETNGLLLASTNSFAGQSGPARSFVETSLNSSYSLPGEAKLDGVKFGNSDAYALGLNARGGVPIDEHWTWSWGLGSQNLFLGSLAGAPIPERINTLSLNTGAGYRFNERWTLNGLIGSSLYRFDDAGGDTFGFSGGVLAMYQASARLKWTFGVMVAPDSDIPALPFVGLSWLINDQFTVEVGIPKTRLSCRLDPKWTLYTGLDMVGTTFRTDEDFGANIGSPKYNNALATYRDIRLGVGVSYKITQKLGAEIEAGGSVYRRIDYKHLDKQVEFDPAPYLRLGLSFRF
jgi:opacity protein-like surface antigen